MDTDSNSSGNGENETRDTLRPSEILPRNEPESLGGYIFVCNNKTIEEFLRRNLFGLPHRYREAVIAIKPGLPLFLFNFSTWQLHGIFEAASSGGFDIEPSAWEDQNNPGNSRYPAQVRVVTRKECKPLTYYSFKPFIHHYEGRRFRDFRRELNVRQAMSLMNLFAKNNR